MSRVPRLMGRLLRRGSSTPPDLAPTAECATPAFLPGQDVSRALAAFMFADLRSFTAYTATRGDEAAHRLVQDFYGLIRQETARYGGREVKTAGDQMFTVFPTAHQAVGGAIALMKALEEYNAGHADDPLRAGIGLDVGEPVEDAGDFTGSALNRAARLTALAGPGEVLVTGVVRHLAGHLSGVSYVELGPRLLRGFPERVPIYAVAGPGRPRRNAQHRRPPVLATATAAAGVMLALHVFHPAGLVPRALVASVHAEIQSVSAKVPYRTLAGVAAEARGFTIRIATKGPDALGLGTAVIYEPSGLAVTAAHVVEGVEEVEAHLATGARVMGKVLGRSKETDLAILALPRGPYPSAVFGDSYGVQVGDELIAVGYPLAFALGSEPTVTRAMVSKRAESLRGQYLQLDASVNPGDSGGPVLDREGRVVGITVSRIESLGGRAVRGISFAVPGNLVRTVLRGLEVGAPPQPEGMEAPLLSPDNLVRGFHRLLSAGEVDLAYALVSVRLKAGLSIAEFGARYGYPGTLAAEVLETVLAYRTEDLALVDTVVLVSELARGEIRTTQIEQRWRLVRESQEWRIDGLGADRGPHADLLRAR